MGLTDFKRYLLNNPVFFQTYDSCPLCKVVCGVANTHPEGIVMEKHRAPCGAWCGRGLFHGPNPHFATSCPKCNSQGSMGSDPGTT